MLVKGIFEEMNDNDVIVVLEDYNNVSFWVALNDLPEGVQEGDIIDIEVPDDFQIPTERSLEEPYESEGRFRGVGIDHEETERRNAEVRRLLRELGHMV